MALDELPPETWRQRLKRILLGFDAWVDFSVFRSATGLRESYERFSTFMDRFHVSGWKRWGPNSPRKAPPWGWPAASSCWRWRRRPSR